VVKKIEVISRLDESIHDFMRHSDQPNLSRPKTATPKANDTSNTPPDIAPPNRPGSKSNHIKSPTSDKKECHPKALILSV